MIGATDGEHKVLEQPKNSGSHYRNYKVTDSIIFMAVLGPDYQFLYVDVGLNRRNTDGGAWSQSSMKKALEKNTLNIPKPTPPSGVQSFGSHYNRLSATVFPKRFASTARLFSPFFDSLVFGCGAVGLSKLFARAIYKAALASLS